MSARHSFSRFLGASALCALPLPALAQDGPSLWDLLKPEYLVQRMVQTGVMALRTQMDIQYGDMAVDLRVGQVAITDISVWPLPDWDVEVECRLSFDRLTIRAAPLNRPDLVRLKMQVQGASATLDCLPPDQRPMMAMVGIESFDLPRLTVDMEYDIAQASADVHAYAQIDGVAAVDVTGDLSYLWFDARGNPDNPDPVIYLRRATATVENLGGFEAVKGMLPPPFVDPAQAPGILGGLLNDALAGMNGGDGTMNAAQTEFAQSLTTAWAAFLQDPQRLVVETGFSPEDELFLDVIAYEDDPQMMFTDLRPMVSLTPATARAALPAALVSQAMGDGAATMADEDRRRVGVALITGVGAPRNTTSGVDLLTPLAEAGDGPAALALSEALEDSAPAVSYRWALLAGGDAQSGAAARLDRLEQVLPFAEVLEIQAQVIGNVQHPLEALQKVSLMRDEAMGRLSGVGRVRSYSVAALWAIMGAAAGDSESRDILEQIDERVSMADDAGRAAWAEAETAASDLAMQAWLGQDLPARFGGE
jgi:hypothetical protein